MSSQYLGRYAEPEARLYLSSPTEQQLDHCLVIPAYREKARLAERLSNAIQRHSNLLIILILNQPDNDPSADPNRSLRRALKPNQQLLVLERETHLASREGVGLARKIGCDVACALMHSGRLKPGWIHCTDADALLPEDYFAKAEKLKSSAGAICHPFQHTLDGENRLIMALYELKLHAYVLALRKAGSPYAFHTLGSSLSIRSDVYEKIRGFPRRAGGEDFYLLNKAAKVAAIATPTEPTIGLEARASSRVPFGTGPALAKLSQSNDPAGEPLFYHPECYAALAATLSALQQQANLESALEPHRHAYEIWVNMGLERALQHCHQHSKDHAGFMRHLHQWLDGFRTLKFVHAMRDMGYTDQSFRDISADDSPLDHLHNCRKQLGWNPALEH